MQELHLDLSGLVRVHARLPQPEAYDLARRFRTLVSREPVGAPDVEVLPLERPPRITDSGRQMQALYGCWVGRQQDRPALLRLKQGQVDLMLLPERPVRLFYQPRSGSARAVNWGLALLFQRLLAARGALLLHAAAMARDGRLILFAGRRGVRKTQTALTLLRQGWDYLADDKLLLHGGRLQRLQDSVLVRDHLLQALPWLADGHPALRAMGRGAARRARLRSLAHALLPERLLPNEDRLFNAGRDMKLAELFPVGELLDSGRPDTLVLVGHGGQPGCTPLPLSDALDRLALLKDLADAEFTHAHWLLTLEGAQPLPATRPLLEAQLQELRCVALGIGEQTPVQRIAEEIAAC